MALRNGFGTVKGILNGTAVVACVARLKFQQRARITHLCGSYTVAQGSPLTAPSFQVGGILVLKGDLDTDAVCPDLSEVNAWINSGAAKTAGNRDANDPVFEARWSGDAYRSFYFGDRGIPLNANENYSVVLPVPVVNGAALPTVLALMGVLHVNGWIEGEDEPYGKMR